MAIDFRFNFDFLLFVFGEEEEDYLSAYAMNGSHEKGINTLATQKIRTSRKREKKKESLSCPLACFLGCYLGLGLGLLGGRGIVPTSLPCPIDPHGNNRKEAPPPLLILLFLLLLLLLLRIRVECSYFSFLLWLLLSVQSTQDSV